MALYVGYSRIEKPIDSIISLSSYLPFIDEFDQLINKETIDQPIFCAHGDSDEVVKLEWGTQSFERLQQLGVQGEFKVYRGIGHSIPLDGLEDIDRFIRKRMP